MEGGREGEVREGGEPWWCLKERRKCWSWVHSLRSLGPLREVEKREEKEGKIPEVDDCVAYRRKRC